MEAIVDIIKVLVVVAFFIVSVLAKGKRKPQGTGLPLPRGEEPSLPPAPPRPWSEQQRPAAQAEKRPLGFEIPHLKGAPQRPAGPDEDGVYREPQEARVRQGTAGVQPAASPTAEGRVLTNEDAWIDAEGVVREPGVLASEAAERLREQAADAARAAAYARERRAEEAAAYARAAKLPGAAGERAPRRFTPQAAREAVVLAAIIGPPKALQGRGWRGGRRN